MSCLDSNGNEILNFILNEDGTVVGSVEIINISGGTLELPLEKYSVVKNTVQTVKLTKECCESHNFTYDEFNGNCYWSLPCENDNEYDIVLGANQFENIFFDYVSGETCVLKGKLDFLINYKCEDLLQCYVSNSGNTLSITEKNSVIIDKLNKENENLNFLILELEKNNQNIEKNILNEIIEISALIESIENQNFLLNEKKENLLLSDDEKDQIELVKVVKDIQVNNVNISQNKQKLNDIDIKQKNILTNTNEINLLKEQYNSNLLKIDELLKDDTNNDVNLTYSNLLECLKINFNIDVINQSNSGNTITRVFSENLYGFDNLLSYLTSLNNNDSGILLDGENCDLFVNNILNELGEDCDLVNENTFNSNWLTIDFSIVDESILELIRNKEIRISFTVKNECCCPFSLLLDNIQVNKVCEVIDDNFQLVKGCFGFEIEKVIDNKKTWVNTEGFHKREYGLPFRNTSYDINDYRLSINTKEVDLTLNLSNAVEIDLFDFIKNNNCLISCSDNQTIVNYIIDENYLSYIQDEDLVLNLMDEESFNLINTIDGCGDCFLMSGYCGDVFLDLTQLITTDISVLDRPEEIREVIISELVDVKNRKILSEYPTLRALYHRYLNSLEFCGVNSASYTIYDIEKFSLLLGNYWVDLVEQFIPSTTIWDATHIYSNTLFEQDKFKYKSTSTYTCSRFNTNDIIGFNLNVGVVIEDITDVIDNSCIIKDNLTNCNGVYIYQYDNGSEFFGSIVDTGIMTNPSGEIINSGDTGVIISSPVITEIFDEIN